MKLKYLVILCLVFFGFAPALLWAKVATHVPSSNLVGLDWNSASSQEELIAISASTGKTSVIAAVPEINAISAMASVLDNTTKKLYQYGQTAERVNTLWTIDASTGEVLASVPVERSPSNLFMRSDGQLIGLDWNTDTEEEELIAIDASTGAASVIAAIPEISTISMAAVAIDVSAEWLYQYGQTAEQVDTLWTIDVSTGTVLASVPVERSPSNLFMRSDGQLIGLDWNASTAEEELIAIDASTGGSTVIAVIPDIAVIAATAAEVDNAQCRLYQYGQTESAAEKLWTIDTSTGAVIQSKSVSRSPSNLFLRSK